MVQSRPKKSSPIVKQNQSCRLLYNISVLTVCVNSSAAGSDIGGQCKVRDPQVLNVDIPERVPYRLIKVLAREHGRNRVREIQQLSAPIRHFLGDN